MYDLCTCCSCWHYNAHLLRCKSSVCIENEKWKINEIFFGKKWRMQKRSTHRNCVWTVAPLPSVGLTSAIFGAKSIGNVFCFMIGLVFSPLVLVVPDILCAPPPVSGLFISRRIDVNRAEFCYLSICIKDQQKKIVVFFIKCLRFKMCTLAGDYTHAHTAMYSRIVLPQNTEFYVDKHLNVIYLYCGLKSGNFSIVPTNFIENKCKMVEFIWSNNSEGIVKK